MLHDRIVACKRQGGIANGDGIIQGVMKQYYASITIQRLAGNGATICFLFFSVGPTLLADFARPAPSWRACFTARGPTMV